MRSGSHVPLGALRNRDVELQTTSPFSNHGSVERSTACFRHKNVLQKQWLFGRCAEGVPTFFQFRASWSGSLETRDKNLD